VKFTAGRKRRKEINAEAASTAEKTRECDKKDKLVMRGKQGN
jgi:hypothetical protein